MHSISENKITIAAGVSSGVGRELSQMLAERGARVFGAVEDNFKRIDL